MRSQTIRTTEHDETVARAVNYLASHGFHTIMADVPQMTSPVLITWTSNGKGHVPDISAIDINGASHIFEVETADCLNIQHTADQITLFSAYASQYGATFWLVVPPGAGQEAGALVARMQANAKVWEI